MNNLLIATGLPLSCVNYQNGICYLNTGNGFNIIPAYINKDQLLLDMSSGVNINNKNLSILITYTTSSI